MLLVEKHIKNSSLPSQLADSLGLLYTEIVTKEHKKKEGQFFTPIEISAFMGSIATPPKTKHISILDPGCGTAILSCSLIEKLVKFDIDSIELTAYETDFELQLYTTTVLQVIKKWLAAKGIKFKYILKSVDFIEDISNNIEAHQASYDYIISNPPYFKLPKDDFRVKFLKHLVKGQPNIYSFFMAVSVDLLKEDGELIFIVPRSFSSGQYFNSFRDYFFKHINLNFVHLFKSRTKTFDRDKVLQETLILRASKRPSDKVVVSTSNGINDINNSTERIYEIEDIIDLESKAKILHLPTTEYEERVMQLFKSWKYNLIDFNIQVSTGRVVSFRSKEFLYDTFKNNTVTLTPLYWLNNISKMNIEWPVNVNNRSQYIEISEDSKRILLPNNNYVFLRRFSSKDDKSRLIAAPYFKGFNNTEWIGVENKLNYIYSLDGELERNEVVGISALLNSEIYDTYFRTFNGNINVSATEIRLMQFPPIESIRNLGDYLISKNDFSESKINTIVNLWFDQKVKINE